MLVVEEGPWYRPDEHEPFSLDEFVARYRHQGACAALGNPGIAFAEGRGVGGSTEINSGLYHRLPEHLAADWRRDVRASPTSTTDTLDRYAAEIEEHDHRRAASRARRRRRRPRSTRGADELGWRSVEFARVFAYDTPGPRHEAVDVAHAHPARGRRRRPDPAPTPTSPGSSGATAASSAPGRASRHPDGIVGAGHDPRRARLRVRRRDPVARRSCSAAASGATSATA